MRSARVRTYIVMKLGAPDRYTQFFNTAYIKNFFLKYTDHAFLLPSSHQVRMSNS